MTGGVRVRFPVASRIFSSPRRQTGYGPTQPHIKWVLRVLSLVGLKQRGREVDHSAPTNVEVKKTWIYTSTPPPVFMAFCLTS
jgi:hypothetical protein